MSDFHCPKCCRRRPLAQKSKRKVGYSFACTVCDEQIRARVMASKKKEFEQVSRA